MKKNTFVADEHEDGLRLDSVLARHRPEQSRASAVRAIESGSVSVDGKIARQGKQRLHAGQKVEVKPLRITPIAPLVFDRIYEDDDCLVINKPAGLLVHGRGGLNDEATVASSFRDQTSDTDPVRGGIVHRLDRDTSGLLLLAKSTSAKTYFQKQFQERSIEKVYHAIVEGSVKEEKAILKWPIQRNPKKPHIFRVGANGKPAETRIHRITGNEHFSKLQLRPITGRTHQLRVHLAHYGHPIVGDVLYSNAPSDRLYLHATKLRFMNMQQQVIELEVPPKWNETRFGFTESQTT